MAWLISQIQASTCLFSITSGTSTSSLPLALLQCMVHRGQALIAPSSITIMIHTTLCVFNKHILVVIINLFSSFSLDEILLVFMTLRIYNHIGHNVCLVKWIASIHSQDICLVSYLAKLISPLIVSSFKHQNPQGGLDALSASMPHHFWVASTQLDHRPPSHWVVGWTGKRWATPGSRPAGRVGGMGRQAKQARAPSWVAWTVRPNRPKPPRGSWQKIYSWALQVPVNNRIFFTKLWLVVYL
jgi:hypothetical protein